MVLSNAHRRVLRAAVCATVLLLGSFPAPLTAADGENIEALAALAERYANRGEMKTAAKIYLAYFKSLKGADAAAAVLYKSGVVFFAVGDWGQAAARFKELASRADTAGFDRRLVKSYQAFCHIQRGEEKEALQALSGEISSLDKASPRAEIGAILAGALAQAGKSNDAYAVMDKTYREASSAAERESVIQRMAGLTERIGASAVIIAAREMGVNEIADSLILPWLERLAESGRSDVVAEAARLIGQWGPDVSVRRRLDAAVELSRETRKSGGVKIGVLLPLSGNYQFFGQKIQQAVKLAMDDIDASTATVLFRDTRGDAEAARLAAFELIDGEQVAAIIGPILSAEAEKVIQVARERRVPVLSPAAQASNLTGQGGYFFRNCLTLRQQGQHQAELAVKGLGLTKFAIISPNDNYGKTLSKVFWDEVLALGGKVLSFAEYNIDQTDFSKQIRAIKGEETVGADENQDDLYEPPFEAIYVPDAYAKVGLIAPQLSFHDIDKNEIILIGSSGLNTPEFIKIGEEYVQGAVFLDGFFSGREDDRTRRFVAAYRARFDETPDVMAAQAYDAAGIMIALARQGKRSAEEMRLGLASLRDYPGVCGLTGFDDTGESVRDPVFITVMKGHLAELELSPAGHFPLTNSGASDNY